MVVLSTSIELIVVAVIDLVRILFGADTPEFQ